MPGPAPKPTALKLIEGNPGKRTLNKNEPKFGGAPVCPTWLSPDAKTEWKRVVKELSALDMLRSVDSSALAAYCQSYSRWQSAERMIDCDGQTVQEPITNKAGEVVGHKIKCHPAVGIARNALTAMLRASALFGFDPSSRSRLSVGEPTAADPFELFMQGIGANESHDAEEALPNPR
jgi:P27 family predicted phage terminase small subunit